MNRAMAEDVPQLEVMAAKNGAKTNGFSSPLALRSSFRKRQPRPELDTLGWAGRAIRLAGAK